MSRAQLTAAGLLMTLPASGGNALLVTPPVCCRTFERDGMRVTTYSHLLDALLVALIFDSSGDRRLLRPQWLADRHLAGRAHVSGAGRGGGQPRASRSIPRVVRPGSWLTAVAALRCADPREPVGGAANTGSRLSTAYRRGVADQSVGRRCTARDRAGAADRRRSLML